MTPCRSRCALVLCLAALLAACASGPTRSVTGAAVAVWDVDDLSPAGSSGRPSLGEILSAQVIDAIRQKGGYEVVERERLLLILEELALGAGELADEGTRLRLGRIAGARLMVFGGYQVIGDRMRLDLRLVDVETGKVRKAVQRTVPAHDLPAWLDGARQAAEELL
jgi:curli biogenesis system outer membrane secretion channel CsgG